MPKITSHQTGFSIVEPLLLLVVFVVVGVVGFYVYHHKHQTTIARTNPTSSTSTTNNTNATAPNQTDNQSLQADLGSANSALTQGSQDLSNSNTSLNDQSTFTTLP